MKRFFIWMIVGVISLASMNGCSETQENSTNIDNELTTNEIAREETNVTPVDSPKATLYLDK